jgi:hypothetical protein
VHAHHVAKRDHVWVFLNRQFRSHRHSSPAVECCATGGGECSRQFTGNDTGRPDDRSRRDVRAFAVRAFTYDRLFVEIDDRRVEEHGDPEPLQRVRRSCREPWQKRWQEAPGCLDEQNPGATRIDRMEVARLRTA